MSNAITTISQIVGKATDALKRTYTENDLGEKVVDEVLEISIYPQVHITNDQQRESYHASVVNECARLMAAFPMRSYAQQQSFYSILYGAIEESKMPIQRLHDAISKLIREHRYSFFAPADILSFDNTITLSTSIGALKRKEKGITDENIVAVYGAINGNVRRMYGIKEDVESSVYADRVIGRWDKERNCFEWIGSYDDPTIPQRQQTFKESLYKYCNTPPYNGKYDVNVVKAFYEHYSQVIMPGDRLLFESYMSFNAAIFLENFSHKLNQQ